MDKISSSAPEVATEKAAAEKEAAERAAAEKAAAGKAAAEREAAEKAAAEKEAAERAAAEKAAAEREAAEKAAAEKEAAEKEAAEKAAAEKAAAEREAAERAAAEKAAAEKAAQEKAAHAPILFPSSLDHLLATTPLIPLQMPPKETEEQQETPSERMLIGGVLSGTVVNCDYSGDPAVYEVSVNRKKSEQEEEQWTVLISYNRFRALAEVLRHEYPTVTIPKLPSPPKKSHANQNLVEMNKFLSGLLTLRNGGLIGHCFQDGSFTPEEALTRDILQLVLRGYGIHNPLGQREGGVRVKLVLEDVGDVWGYLKDESRLALQNGCCADCGVRIGMKRKMRTVGISNRNV